MSEATPTSTPTPTPTPAPLWLVRFPPPDRRWCSVQAHTKSEARALAKAYFQIATGGRLPVGTSLKRME